MKRWWIVFILLIFLAACAKETVIKPQTSQEPSIQNTEPTKIVPTLKPKFKLINELGKRTPNTIYGIIKNTGNATGTAKVTARLYYAQVIVDEKSQTVEDVEPEKEANFSILMNEGANFNSFKTIVEVAS